jgi:adenosylcobyric acid synthase
LKETRILGICGGYQVLGRRLSDPQGIEGGILEEEGLGLIPMDTRIMPLKVTRQVTGRLKEEPRLPVRGYEIHMGRSTGHRPLTPLILLEGGEEEGYRSDDGRVLGTYLHGIFDSPSFSERLFNPVRRARGLKPVKSLDHDVIRETHLDALADLMRQSLNMAKIYRIIEGR